MPSCLKMNHLYLFILGALLLLKIDMAAEEIKIYRGDSTSWTNIVMTFSDEFRTGELLGLVYLFFPGDCM